MPRPRPLPSEDQLLDAEAARTLIVVSKSRWDGYWKRFPVLVRGVRVVKVNPEGKGVRRWLRSAIVEHMHRELQGDSLSRTARASRGSGESR